MRFNDALIGVGIIIFGLVVIIHVQSFPLMGGRPTPAMFPMVIGALLMLVGTVLIYSGVKSGAPLVTFLEDFNVKGLCNVMMVFAGVVFYIYTAQWLGFLITSFCIMFVMMLMLKGRLLPSAVSSACVAVFAYAVFNMVLAVPLPRGILHIESTFPFVIVSFWG